MVSQRTEEFIKADVAHIIHPYAPVGQHMGIVFEKAHGVYIVDTEGKEYLDVSSQLMCSNLGHGQKEIADAVSEAIHKTDYTTCFYGFGNPYNIECARKLAEITPGDLNHFYFTCGGSESVDSAIKIARLYWHNKGQDTKYKIISLYNSYHGETGISTYLTRMGRGAPQLGFGPEPAGFLRIPPYYEYRCMFGDVPDGGMMSARFLKEIILGEGPDSVAAFLAEPVQGSGGIIVPPDEWWPTVRKICTEHNVLLIGDEVMSGFARTGKMFALEHWNVVPDIMTMAKGITGAYLPYGAVAVNDEIYEALKGKLFWHGLTYAGHPVASAAAVAALDLYKKLNVADNAAKVGAHIRERLDREFLPLPCVGAIDGKGMFQAVELVNDKESKAVIDANVKAELFKKILQGGVYLRITGGLGNRMFICPPCTMTIEEADKALDIIQPLVAELKPI